MPNIQQQFGDKLKKLRNQKGLSQEELAFKCGLHRTYISDIERGSRNVSLKNIEKVAKALKININELFKNS